MIYSLVFSHDICIARTRQNSRRPDLFVDGILQQSVFLGSYGNVVRPLYRTNNLLALLCVCRQVNQEISHELIFREIRFSFRQLLPPTRLRHILKYHTLLQLSNAQRACITTITTETFQFISMVDNWPRPIACNVSGLRTFLELLPELKHVEIVGYQRGFHRKSMTRGNIYLGSTWDLRRSQHSSQHSSLSSARRSQASPLLSVRWIDCRYHTSMGSVVMIGWDICNQLHNLSIMWHSSALLLLSYRPSPISQVM